MTEVDQAECWTNPTYLTDFVEFIPDPKRVDPTKITLLYTEKLLSCYQIADLTGLSKTAVVEKLNEAGIKERHHGGDKNNFRFKNPPYGFRVADGKLTPDRQEMKIIRMLVENRDRKKMTAQEIADDLNASKIKPRLGQTWSAKNVRTVYGKWKGKI